MDIQKLPPEYFAEVVSTLSNLTEQKYRFTETDLKVFILAVEITKIYCKEHNIDLIDAEIKRQEAVERLEEK